MKARTNDRLYFYTIWPQVSLSVWSQKGVKGSPGTVVIMIQNKRWLIIGLIVVVLILLGTLFIARYASPMDLYVRDLILRAASYYESLDRGGVVLELESSGNHLPAWMTAARQFAFEMKLRNWQRALVQAFRYRSFAEASVLLDKKNISPALRQIEKFERANVGLLSIDHLGVVATHHQPKYDAPFCTLMRANLEKIIYASPTSEPDSHLTESGEIMRLCLGNT